MTNYVVSGYIGFDNFGDEAIAQVLTSYLKKIQAEKITLISSNPTKTAKLYGVNSVGMFDFIKPIIESDILISGGGSLLQDVTSLKSLLYYLSVILLAMALGKKVYIFAQGFTPFRTKIGKFLTKFVLKRCDKISVRDFKSHEFLNNMGIKSELVSDPVFGITIPEKQKSGVGIQLRSFDRLDDVFLKKLAEKIAQEFSGEEIKLISLQDSYDLNVLIKFGQYLKEKGVDYKIYQNLDVEKAIDIISSVEYLIGMRFHANLVAAKAGVKILGINYDIKVKTLAQKVGFPIINLDSNEIEKGFKDLKIVKFSEYKIPEFTFPEL